MIHVAIIGLDSSHSIEFTKVLQDKSIPPDNRVQGMRVATCMRFETPFQNAEGLDKRQAQLESLGVRVTSSLDETLVDCDAIMLEINDGALHLDYFKKIAALGKPVFLDKPLANSLSDGRAIIRLMHKHNTRVWSGSSIPFIPEIAQSRSQFTKVTRAHVFGALGNALSGDSLIWYGVHTFEMLQRILGPGAQSVRALETNNSILATVDYDDGREGVVETVRGLWTYGGYLHGQAGDESKLIPFVCNAKHVYRDILLQVKAFFKGGPAPVDMRATFEGLAIMTAARRSIETGKTVKVPTLNTGKNLP